MRIKKRAKNPRCPECYSSYTWKMGKRTVWGNGKKVIRQAYQCQDCGYQWRSKDGA